MGTLLISFILSSFVSAESLYCAEKTKEGAWCQNVALDKVNTAYRYEQTSCEATSYCKLGTCINQNEGVCYSNVPETTCKEEKGVWSEQAPESIEMCKLGCCLLGNQAAFTTQTRCGKLSSDYNLKMDFRSDISQEAVCIASAYPTVKGACVLDDGLKASCSMITKEDCQKRSAAASAGTDVKFYDGLLCTASSLQICSPSKRTTCVEGKEEVYFLDSCNNIANIYDAARAEDPDYWESIIEYEDVCKLTYQDNGIISNSNTCGNCNYFMGSTCKASERTDSIKPAYGNNICASLDCSWKGQTYLHGESWCESSAPKNSENLPGADYSRMLCYDGEIIQEPCAPFRQEYCFEGEIAEGVSAAKCVVNKWQTCALQSNQKDCENEDQRDCVWQTTVPSGINWSMTILGSGNLTGTGICVPKYTPGLKFWDATSKPETTCNIGTTSCVVTFKRSLIAAAWEAFTDLFKKDENHDDEYWKCDENCECIGNEWKNSANSLCGAFGDCGVKTNYIGGVGYNTEIQVTINVLKGEQESTE